MDSAIKFICHADGTHAAFRRRNGMVIENFWPHVHERELAIGEQVEWYELAGMTKREGDNLESWFDKEMSNPSPYSIADLIRYAVNLPPKHGRGCFCSQWVCRGLREAVARERQPLVRLPFRDWVSPAMIRMSPRLICVN